jgi:16S rRNA (adenine1518-N6/adenine1519-N6)-dimethyltransferase
MQHRARKRFGQNFLHDPGVISRIVASIAPRAGDHLVEIGPGLGAITKELLPRIGIMDAIELDRDLLIPLQTLCAPLGQLTLHAADALRFDFRQLAQGQPLRVIGNLPYNISTPLLFHLLDQQGGIADMHFMLQKEVVERMAADPGNKSYGRLSVILQYQCRVDHLFDIPPEAFTPAPKVDSAFVRLQPRTMTEVESHSGIANDPAWLSSLVTSAFAHRRKTLHNNLKGIATDPQLRACDINPSCRAEELSVADFVRLANVTMAVA